MSKKKNAVRPDGRICVQVYIGREDGKRRYVTVYGATQKEADQKAEEVKAKMRKGIDVRRRNDTFAEWAELWLSVKSADIGSSQRKNYERYIQRYNDAFGFRPIDEIKMIDIQKVINNLRAMNENTGKPASKKLLNGMRQTAVQIFRFAVQNRVLEYNPADGVTVPKGAPAARRDALTEEEQTWIRTTPHPVQLAAMIMLFAGLRKGELIALTWQDVDLEAGTITVSKAVEYENDVPRLKTPKTEAGVRTVFIPDVLRELLQNAPKNGPLVFPNPQGEMYRLKQFQRLWDGYLLDLDMLYGKIPERKSKCDPRFKGVVGIRRFTPHMLRHTYCTMLYEAGVDVVTARDQMGHTDIKTTLSIYTHLTDSHAKEEMQKLNSKYA